MTEKNKTALVIGSGGMVGYALVSQLLADDRFSEVHSFVRRPTHPAHPRLTEHIVDFEQPEKWHPLLKGDVFFSCLGTTLRTAGSKAAQYKVDVNYQLEAARAASANGVSAYVLISSAGASPKARSFYMRMKGELEEAVATLPFQTIQIMKPAQLDGDRKENRPGERFGLKVMYAVNKLGLFKKFRPVHADILSRAMIVASQKPESGVYQFDKIFEIAEEQ